MFYKAYLFQRNFKGCLIEEDLLNYDLMKLKILVTLETASFLTSMQIFTRNGCILKFSPTGTRMREDALVIPGTFSVIFKS